jgi:polar amino acid transport system permease protein
VDAIAPPAGEQRVASPPPEPIVAVPVRHPGRWVAAGVVLAIVAAFIYSLFTTAGYHWDVVQYWFTSSQVLNGLKNTIVLTVIAMAVGICGGIVLAVMRLSPNPLVKGSAWVYVWVFRGTPVLVQLIFWYYVSAIYPTITIGIPFGPAFWHGSANSFITPLVAAILGLGLNEAAYMSEIVRAGMLSVDPGQTEAAHALGMSHTDTLRRVVLPQAMRVIIPPTGNETISMLKTTSLVSVIAYTELLYSVEVIYSRTFQEIPLLIVASLWYLIITSILSIVQYYLERRFARGSSRQLPPTPLQRLRRQLAIRHVKPDEVTAAAGGTGT